MKCYDISISLLGYDMITINVIDFLTEHIIPEGTNNLECLDLSCGGACVVTYLVILTEPDL